MFLEISQNSQENTCARVYFLIKLQTFEFYEISKNGFSYRTPPVAVSTFSRGVNLFSFFYTLIWFELKYIAKCLCEDLNVIFRSNRLVVHSLLPVLSSARMYYQAFNQIIVSPSKKIFSWGTNFIGKTCWEGGGVFYMGGLMIRSY